MPNPYFLDSLRNLPNSGFTATPQRRVPGMGEAIPTGLAGENEFQTPEPSVELMGLQQQRLKELDQPRFQDRPDLQGLKRGLTQDIGANPLTQQGNEVESYLGRRAHAVEQGFGGVNPVATQAEAGRQVEQQKMNMPLEVARANSAGDLAKQQEASRGALAVQNSKAGQADNMWDMLAKARAGGADIRGVNVAGQGGVSFGAPPKPSTVPPALLSELLRARMAMDKAGLTKGFMAGGGPTNEKGAFDQAIQSVLSKHPADQSLKDFALAASRDPGADKMSADEIIAASGQQASPEDTATIHELLGLIRGH